MGMIVLGFMGSFVGGDGLASEGIGFVEEEKETEEHDCTADFRETEPDI
jgi:hypothetical protein